MVQCICEDRFLLKILYLEHCKGLHHSSVIEDAGLTYLIGFLRCNNGRGDTLKLAMVDQESIWPGGRDE